jgi:hypothetical protein
MGRMERQHGAGRIYIKHGAYYGRWRALDGRYVNRPLGKVRERGGGEEGFSRREADRVLRRLMDADEARLTPGPEERRLKVDEAAEAFRNRLVVRGSAAPLIVHPLGQRAM